MEEHIPLVPATLRPTAGFATCCSRCDEDTLGSQGGVPGRYKTGGSNITPHTITQLDGQRST